MSNKAKQNLESGLRAEKARLFGAVFFAFAVAVVVFGCAVAFRYQGDGGELTYNTTTGTPLLTLKPPKAESSADSDSSVPTTVAPPETSHSVPPETIAPPVSSDPVTTPPDVPPPATETTAPDSYGDDDPAALTARPLDSGAVADPPAPSVRVEESEAVDSSYFSDALFLGDSRTVGLSLYSGLKSNYYSQQGLNVSTVVSSAYISSGDRKLTLAEALEEHPDFTKVYISFGINEIGWPTTDSFIKAYTALVDLVMEKLPDARIYVQEILPMAKATAENSRYAPMGGNGKVAEYNERLYKLCEEKGIHYIALTEIFADEYGDLTVADSFDGIHLGVASSKEWIEYLKTHTVP